MEDASLRRDLYVSHLLCVFGDRLWQFAMPVMLVYIFPGTLLPPAAFNLLLPVARVSCLPAIGRWIDRAPRMAAVRASAFVQCPLVATSAALLCLAGDNKALIVLAALVGCVGDLAGAAGTIGVEKDWLVVLAPEDEARGALTATMRRIDLSCKLLAPLVAGFLVQMSADQDWPGGPVRVGALLVVAWNLLAALPIYIMWCRVFAAVPELASKPELTQRKEKAPWAVTEYVRHATFPMCLSYACLFFTVLSDHHPVATAYFIDRGLSAVALALARGGGSLAGILGTFLQPRCMASIGVPGTGCIFSWCFFLCVAAIGLIFGLDSSITGAYVALAFIVLSRVALWGFDLTNAAILQRHVEPEKRSSIAGAEGANCQLLELAMCVLCVLLSSPKDFYVLGYLSIGGVGAAALLFSLSLPRLRRMEKLRGEPLLSS